MKYIVTTIDPKSGRYLAELEYEGPVAAVVAAVQARRAGLCAAVRPPLVHWMSRRRIEGQALSRLGWGRD